jgi:tetratricopeptide (TPR) repeat protein
LRRHPGDGGLLLALGSVEELLAQFGEAESRPPGNTMEATRPPEWMRRRAEKARRLEKAEKLFTRALAAEPTLVEARLRRGRTLQLLERASDAESDLARVARETRDPNILYLSHLFRGRLQEKGGDLSAASESYRAAAELGQRPQAANIGLAHVLDLLGDRAGAAEALDRAVAKPTETGPLDGWWEYTFGQPLDAEALIEGLRREVHR